MKKILKLLFVFCILIGVFVCGNVTYEGYSLYKEKTAEIEIEEKVNLIKNQDNYVSYNNIPINLVNALVSIEDHRFFYHKGIDIQSVLRAIVTNISQNTLAEGGSTITQQLAKNMYYTQDKNFTRKVAEVFTAYELEKKYSKEDILELYLNIVYFGDGYYGIYDAAKGYFDKEPKSLSLDETTLLAGIPNAPSVYALSNGEDLVKKRQELVVDAMVKYEYISIEESIEIKSNQSEN